MSQDIIRKAYIKCRPCTEFLHGSDLKLQRGCVTAVQYIWFNFANYSSSIAMELKVSKEITCKCKIRYLRQTNMSPAHFFFEVASSRDQL